MTDDHEALTFHPLPTDVGDVNSDAKGSGARFNTGKAPFDLVPVRLIGTSFLSGSTVGPTSAACALICLGRFQARRHAPDELLQLLERLGLDGWEECAAVFAYGKKKYKAWNWCKGMAWSIPIACATRHLLAMLRGEAVDPESGLPHRGHVFCNIVMLLTYVHTFPEGDDRPAEGLL